MNICPTRLTLEPSLISKPLRVFIRFALCPPGCLIYNDPTKHARVYEIDAYINQLYGMQFATAPLSTSGSLSV